MSPSSLRATVVMPRLAVVGVGEAFLDRRGDLGVEHHHTFLLGQFGEVELPGQRGLHPPPRGGIPARHRASYPCPVLEPLFGRAAFGARLRPPRWRAGRRRSGSLGHRVRPWLLDPVAMCNTGSRVLQPRWAVARRLDLPSRIAATTARRVLIDTIRVRRDLPRAPVQQQHQCHSTLSGREAISCEET